MIRAMYTAASGMLVESQRLDVVANNLANAQTPGFKALDFLRVSVPPDRPGSASDVQTTHRGEFLNIQTGNIRLTGVPLDLAVDGPGFLTIQVQGGEALTRNGRLRLSPDGTLVNDKGDPVLGETGPIRVPPGAKVTVAGDGTVRADGAVLDRFRLQTVSDPGALRPAGASLLYPLPGQELRPATGQLVQGALEDSNVSAMAEMGRMVETLRAFEAYQKVIQSVMDEATGAAVRQIGRVG